jgi:signal transduction histidine kinase
MEVVGQLTGGVAHDFNNLLAVLRGQVEMIQDDLAVLERTRDRLSSVERATERASALTDDLLSFTRRVDQEPRVVDVHDLVRSMPDMLEQLLPECVELTLALDATECEVLAEPNRIEQALVNLAVNARDAMPDGGTLTIGSADVADRHGHLRAIRLVVADTGTGMDAGTRARVFEPFFTTKEPGRGTGLGLSTTLSIVRRLHGVIDVASEPGQGSAFSITLPLAEASEPTQPETEGARARVATVAADGHPSKR